MTSRSPEPLADGALAQLLSQMRDTGSAAQAVAPANVARTKHWTSFETHPLFQQMMLQRNFAGNVGLDDPYYRLHNSRSGATAVIADRKVVNFASYDYLGLNGDPRILEAVGAAVQEFGTSVSASRISAGERPVHLALERALAANYEAEDCIAFVSGHAAAVSMIATLMGPKDLILHDALIHNCIVVGAQLAGGTRRNFPHNDFNALEKMLAADRHRFERVLIVTEGLFSMDGDGPDLSQLVDLKQRFGAWLMVDDAHGLGVLGERGRGIFEHQGVSPAGIDLWLGTLSKSLVSCGGYVAGSHTAIDLLKHQAPGFVYSVGMPATNAVAATTALEIMNREPQRVALLQRQSERFRNGAQAKGLDIGTAWGFGIVPVVIGDTIVTLRLAERLLQRGINAFPVLPPGIPEKTARLRFFINATHTDDQIDETIAILAEEFEGLKNFSLKNLLAR